MPHRRPSQPRRRRPARPALTRAAFTLVELMISIALVALLIVGVNQVFLYTSEAIGSGEAINAAVRDGRSIQKALGDDLLAAVPNGLDANSSAAFVITSTAVYAYRNPADLGNDRDANPATVDLDGDGTEGNAPGETTSPMTYNFRNHRSDTLSFFARGNFPRQTGGTFGPFVANMTSTEAWIWYGHLQLPDNTSAVPGAVVPPADFFSAGITAAGPSPAVNPNNYFSGQFVLGRQAILLRPGVYQFAAAPSPIYDTAIAGSQQSQMYIPSSSYNPNLHNNPKWPFSAGLVSADGYALKQSRYDLAEGTIPKIQRSLSEWVAASPVTVNWWTAANYIHAFECNPFVPKPVTPAAMAQASPYFLRGCSQFTVEFAGDFVTQNNDPTDVTYNNTLVPNGPQNITPYTVKSTDGTYGDVIADGADGVLDFYVDKSADLSAGTTVPALWRRHVRWYGLPRDDNGDGVIKGFAGTANGFSPATLVQSNNTLVDVVPVRDVVSTTVHPELLPAAYNGESFEHYPDPLLTGDQKTAPGTNPVSSAKANYAAVLAPTAAPFTNYASYVAAFGPSDPRVKFIRITITLEDPSGRLRDGQTYQYVFPVGSK